MAVRIVRSGAGLAAIAGLLLLTGPVQADQKKSDRSTPQNQTHVKQPTPGLTAAVDPVTGHLRPMSRAEAVELLRQMAPLFKSMSAPAAVALPGGGYAMAVDDSLVNFYLARTNADGSIGQACIGSEHAAAEFLLGSTPAAQEDR